MGHLPFAVMVVSIIHINGAFFKSSLLFPKNNAIINAETPKEAQTVKLIREIDQFVNFANRDADWRRGYMTYYQAQLDAKHDGIIQGSLNTLKSLVKQGLLSIEVASAQANMSVSEFQNLINESR